MEDQIFEISEKIVNKRDFYKKPVDLMFIRYHISKACRDDAVFKNYNYLFGDWNQDSKCPR